MRRAKEAEEGGDERGRCRNFSVTMSAVELETQNWYPLVVWQRNPLASTGIY